MNFYYYLVCEIKERVEMEESEMDINRMLFIIKGNFDFK